MIVIRAIQAETYSEPVWTSGRIDLGWLDGTKSLTANKRVTWDPAKTSLESAQLAVSAYSETPYGSTEMKIYLNGQEIMTKFWDFSGPHIATADILSQVANGPNAFVVTYAKNPVINLEAHLTITATLEYAFSGEEPDVGGDWLADLIDWINHNKYTLVGVSMAGVGIAYYGSRKGWWF